MARVLKQPHRPSAQRGRRSRRRLTIEEQETEILSRHLPADEEDNLIADLRLRRDKRVPFEEVLKRYGYRAVED